MKVDYKISYGKRFDDEGTCYRQMINVKMTEQDLSYFNALVRKGKNESGDRNFSMYAEELKKGDNYVHLTTARYFAYMAEIVGDKRYKDKNTIIRVNII